MERWWFHMIAGPDGTESQIRVILRAGDDESAFPKVQVTMAGEEVPVDDAEVDYEAPEWKAVRFFTDGGGSQGQWDDIKDRLRAQAG